MVLASLKDDTIFTGATANNQHLWSRGDVFEIFVRDLERNEYLELHIAPNGHRLQLRFPDDQAIGRLPKGPMTLEDYMVDAPLFEFSTRTVPGGWDVWARIPVASLRSAQENTTGMSLLASFSRYDYADEKTPPVLSSTSAHTVLNYHRQQEWMRLDLAG